MGNGAKMILVRCIGVAMQRYRHLRVPSLSLIALLLLGSAATAANGSVSYTYDALGRVTTVTYDTGVIVIYTYDANGNRTQQVININTTTMNWNTTSPCTSNCWGAGNWQ